MAADAVKRVRRGEGLAIVEFNALTKGKDPFCGGVVGFPGRCELCLRALVGARAHKVAVKLIAARCVDVAGYSDRIKGVIRAGVRKRDPGDASTLWCGRHHRTAQPNKRPAERGSGQRGTGPEAKGAP